MLVSSDRPLKFKFHWMNDKGQAASLLRKKGSFDGETLTLADAVIPAAVVLETLVREARFFFIVPSPDGGTKSSGILLTSKKAAQQLKDSLDIARSAAWAAHHRQELAKKGLGHTYRDATCPACSATILLSRMPRTPQIYCPCCHTLTNQDETGVPIAEARHYHLCDECGMFSRPRKFTILYFYWVIVFYVWRTRTTWQCPSCMRPTAWKMLLCNLPFLAGVPVAIFQLLRSYSGDLTGGSFAGLETGNRAARAGKFPRAIEKYRTILERHGHAAGVKYNLGLALLQQGDRRRAAETFRLALEDCANYGPAHRQLRLLYEQLGERENLARLQAVWEETEEPVEEAALAC